MTQKSDSDWERTPEELERARQIEEEHGKYKRECRLRDIEKIRQGTFSLDGVVGELVGVAGFLTAVGIKLQPLFKTQSGRHFVGIISEEGPDIIDSVNEIDISKSGYSFQVYTIEEFLDL